MPKEPPSRSRWTRQSQNTDAQRSVAPPIWGEFPIHIDAKISKGYAIRDYHLVAKDLDGLTFEKQATVKSDTVRQMHLYKEREVHEIALRKYGGRKGFTDMLDKKWCRWNAKRADESRNDFPCPRSYAPLHTGISICDCLPSQREAEITSRYDAATPKILDFKKELEAAGNEWLWKALVDTNAGRALLLKARKSIATWYPRLIAATQSMEESDSFKDLGVVLARAVVSPGEHVPITDNIKQKLAVISISYPEGIRIDWKKDYHDELFDPLLAILVEHGRAGWLCARWKVYDKCVECNMGGPTICSDCPGDYYWGDLGMLKWIELVDLADGLFGEKAKILRTAIG